MICSDTHRLKVQFQLGAGTQTLKMNRDGMNFAILKVTIRGCSPWPRAAFDDKAELQEYDFEVQKRTLVAACECGRDRPIAASALNQTFRQINEFKGLNVAPAATISIPAPRKKLNATKRRSIVTQGTVFHEHTACHM